MANKNVMAIAKERRKKKVGKSGENESEDCELDELLDEIPYFEIIRITVIYQGIETVYLILGSIHVNQESFGCEHGI